jgi:hypothetical protein
VKDVKSILKKKFPNIFRSRENIPPPYKGRIQRHHFIVICLLAALEWKGGRPAAEWKWVDIELDEELEDDEAAGEHRRMRPITKENR